MHGTYYNATIAAYVTLYLRLGKDEVGSSNLPSSSMETLEPQRFEGFKLFIEFVGKTLFPTILPTNLLLGIVKSFVFVTWQ